jgi:hypothetical protein
MALPQEDKVIKLVAPYTAYISGGDMNWVVDMAGFPVLRYTARIGKALTDYVRIDTKTFADRIYAIWKVFEAHIDEPIEEVEKYLVESVSGYIEENIYMAYDAMSYIQFLVESSKASDLPRRNLAGFGMKQLFGQRLEANPIFKSDLDIFMEEDEHTEDLTAIKKLEYLCRQGKLSKDYMNEAYTARIDTIDGETYEETYLFDNSEVMINFEWVETCLHEVQINKCEYCGEYFIPRSRSDSKYCDHIATGETQPCYVIGPGKKRDERVAKSPVMKMHNDAIKRMSKRKILGKMTATDFRYWSFENSKRRDDVMDGLLSIEEYEKWLNETSRRKRGRKPKSDVEE